MLVVNAAIGVGLYLIGAPSPAEIFRRLLIALLIGFEAATLWRWTLARRGWTQIGFVVGDDAEAAEQRFFAGWIARKRRRAAACSAAGPICAAGAARAAVLLRCHRPVSRSRGASR